MANTTVRPTRRIAAQRLVFLASLVVGMAAAGIIAPTLGADADRPTYTLSDFEIQYPYDDPRSYIGPSETRASVSYLVHYPNRNYPGRADCTVNVLGAAGDTVGTLQFELDSLSEGKRSAPMTVDVSALPVTAEGSCVAVRADRSRDGAGYIFTGPTRAARIVVGGEVVPGTTELTFQVRWETPGEYPGMRTCELVVTRGGGRQDPPVVINGNMAEGPFTVNVPGTPGEIEDARMLCKPFTGS